MKSRKALWETPIRLASILSVAAYLRIAYRIRRWGRLPYDRGATLVVANHQHDLDDMAIVSQLTLDGPQRDPIFTFSSRRLFEPGFLAARFPLFEPWLRRYNPARLFDMIGLQPIENQLATRSVASLAWMLYVRRGNFLLQDAFSDTSVQRLGIEGVAASEVNSAVWFRRLQVNAKLSELREPFRGEAITLMRAHLERDLDHIEQVLKSGATFYLAPEGRHTTDGRMGRFRGAYARMAPLAQIYVAAISFDPFAVGRFSMLYRILRCVDMPAETLLRAARPVTLSQLLATWLTAHDAPFIARDAARAVKAQIDALPKRLFLDPELSVESAHAVFGALDSMTRCGLLQNSGGRYTLTDSRVHREFPEVHDILAYQANFLQETMAAAAVTADEPIRV